MSRAFRSEPLTMPSIFCHGREQVGRTRCAICGRDPLFPKVTSSSAGDPLIGASLQPTGNGAAAFSIPFDVVHDQYQDIGDVAE